MLSACTHAKLNIFSECTFGIDCTVAALQGSCSSVGESHVPEITALLQAKMKVSSLCYPDKAMLEVSCTLREHFQIVLKCFSFVLVYWHCACNSFKHWFLCIFYWINVLSTVRYAFASGRSERKDHTWRGFIVLFHYYQFSTHFCARTISCCCCHRFPVSSKPLLPISLLSHTTSGCCEFRFHALLSKITYVYAEIWFQLVSQLFWRNCAFMYARLCVWAQLIYLFAWVVKYA